MCDRIQEKRHRDSTAAVRRWDLADLTTEKAIASQWRLCPQDGTAGREFDFALLLGTYVLRYVPASSERNRNMEDQLTRTPLHAWHEARGAKMVDFGGWEMPLWYPTGAVAEHRAVITNVGLFDTSHMSVLIVTGAGARPLLQRCFTKDLESCVGAADDPLSDGKCVWGAFLDEEGDLIDDAIVSQFSEVEYLCVVNAGMGGTVAMHLQVHAADAAVDITDLTGKVGKVDLQGPLSGRVMKKVLKAPEAVLRGLKYFNFRGHFDTWSGNAEVLLSDGTPILLSRTGYTGEFGFEVFADAGDLLSVWEQLLEAGSEFGIVACGLAARDSLRAGAVLPLSHQDIGPWPFINHPWPFGLPYTKDEKGFKKEFIGDKVLAKVTQADHTIPFAGYDPRKVSVGDPAVVVDSGGDEIGVVLTCVADMALGRVEDRIFSIASPSKPEGFKPKGLCCGFVKVKTRLKAGEIVQLKDKRRSIKVMIVDDIRPDRTARRPMDEMM